MAEDKEKPIPEKERVIQSPAAVREEERAHWNRWYANRDQRDSYMLPG